MTSVLTGANTFGLQAALRQRTADFASKHGDMAVERYDAADIDFPHLLEVLHGISFLTPQKLIVLRDPSAQKQFLEQYEAILAQIPDTTELVIVEPKIDKRTVYYKWLKKHAEVQDFPELAGYKLARWAGQYAKEQGSALGQAEADYLIERVGADQQRLASEIAKLALTGERITRQQIDNQTEPMPQSKIFDLLDAAFAGRAAQAIKLYQEQRQLRVEPQEIIAMLAWQLRLVALAKAADAGGHDMVREAGVSPYSADKAKQIARHLTLAKIKQFVADLTDLDLRSKRVPIDLDEALQLYILKLARA